MRPVFYSVRRWLTRLLAVAVFIGGFPLHITADQDGSLSALAAGLAIAAVTTDSEGAPVPGIFLVTGTVDNGPPFWIKSVHGPARSPLERGGGR